MIRPGDRVLVPVPDGGWLPGTVRKVSEWWSPEQIAVVQEQGTLAEIVVPANTLAVFDRAPFVHTVLIRGRVERWFDVGRASGLDDRDVANLVHTLCDEIDALRTRASKLEEAMRNIRSAIGAIGGN